jgi:mannose-6-phosphate isomerase-like protein (cupin superfamily)/uncharacterized cupin superfamily protein
VSEKTADAFETIVTSFGYAPLAPALWQNDLASGLQFRDLALAQASDDAFLGTHWRAGGVAVSAGTLASRDASFVFLFVLKGQVTVHTEDGSRLLLRALDSAVRHGPGSPVLTEHSHDAELIELRADGEMPTVFGAGDGRWTPSVESEPAYVQGEGPRRYFRYRDLGVAGATGRRIHIHIVRSTKALDGGTGWHSHSMGQLFFVLRGWADLLVERQPAVRMSAGDSMCIAKRMKHNVPAFSADYLVLEMCIPADYDTVDAEP